MKTLLASCAFAVVFLLANAPAQAHERDRVTRVDRYHHAAVVHYDHHHRTVSVDEYGRVIGSRTRHHDHHYVEPHRSYQHHDYDRRDSHRRRFSFFGR